MFSTLTEIWQSMPFEIKLLAIIFIALSIGAIYAIIIPDDNDKV